MTPEHYEPDLHELLDELDKGGARITIRAETRRFSKPTTIISGLTKEKVELEKVARELKKSLATGGSAKDGVIILQGDLRQDAKDLLVKLGYSSSNIEVQ